MKVGYFESLSRKKLLGAILQIISEIPRLVSFRRLYIVPWIQVKIVLNLVKAWNLLRMKLLSFRSKIELGAFRTFSPLVLYANMAVSNTGTLLKEKTSRK